MGLDQCTSRLVLHSVCSLGPLLSFHIIGNTFYLLLLRARPGFAGQTLYQTLISDMLSLVLNSPAHQGCGWPALSRRSCAAAA